MMSLASGFRSVRKQLQPVGPRVLGAAWTDDRRATRPGFCRADWLRQVRSLTDAAQRTDFKSRC